MNASKLTSRLNRLEEAYRQRTLNGPLMCECVPYQFVEDGEPFDDICPQCGRGRLTIIEQVVNSREELENLRLAEEQALQGALPS